MPRAAPHGATGHNFTSVPKPTPKESRNPRQLPLQIRSIPRPILQMMQKPIGVVKDIPLRNALLAIMFPKLPKRPVSNVLPPIRAKRSPAEESNSSLFRPLGIVYFAFPNN